MMNRQQAGLGQSRFARIARIKRIYSSEGLGLIEESALSRQWDLCTVFRTIGFLKNGYHQEPLSREREYSLYDEDNEINKKKGFFS